MIQRGDVDMVRWALDHGGQRWDAQASCGGHLEVVQWLRAKGCPWDSQTCAKAAQHGYLEVIKWSRANGSPWGANTIRLARRRIHLSVLRWAAYNGCPLD
jgi:hypothetical protein